MQFSTGDQRLLEQIIMLRRDVRGNHFNDRSISNDDIEQILHAGSLAPSVCFSQLWEFVVIRNRSTKQAIARASTRSNQHGRHGRVLCGLPDSDYVVDCPCHEHLNRLG
jgi:nitroreductase